MSMRNRRKVGQPGKRCPLRPTPAQIEEAGQIAREVFAEVGTNSDGRFVWQASALAAARLVSPQMIHAAAQVGRRIAKPNPTRAMRNALRQAVRQLEDMLRRVQFPRGHRFKPPGRATVGRASKRDGPTPATNETTRPPTESSFQFDPETGDEGQRTGAVQTRE
jgi:hypothetical protein